MTKRCVQDLGENCRMGWKIKTNGMARREQKVNYSGTGYCYTCWGAIGWGSYHRSCCLLSTCSPRSCIQYPCTQISKPCGFSLWIKISDIHRVPFKNKSLTSATVWSQECGHVLDMVEICCCCDSLERVATSISRNYPVAIQGQNADNTALNAQISLISIFIQISSFF